MPTYLRFLLIKIKYTCLVLIALLLTGILLKYPSECLSYALSGLQLWFNRMIPTLFPFMVLSGIMVRMQLTNAFVTLLKPVLGPFFRIGSSCIYAIIIGFLCGFPMGAYVTVQLYETGNISKNEASFLLSFCNNIGPIYFFSFVLATLNLNPSLYLVFGMYGLPLLYGIFLRYTLYKNKLSYTGQTPKTSVTVSVAAALDDSIFSSLSGITKLGGYMIFFNLLFILPDLLISSPLLQGTLSCLLEITGGIGFMQNKAPILVLCLLPFGGLSCIAQTYSIIKTTDLSLSEYMMHKIILTAITVCYYSLSAGIYFG